MRNKDKKNYSSSIIIEHDLSFDLFEIFIEWLKTQKNVPNITLTKNYLHNNPSFRFMNLEGKNITIDDIRNFNRELSFANYNGKKRYFIFFNSDLITLQAQNAALKSIEEPPTNTQIILLTSTINKLLPTIISRCNVVSLKKSSTKKNEIKEIVTIYQKIQKSKHYELIELSNSYKDRKEAINFFNNLVNYLHQELENKSSDYERNILAKHLKMSLQTIELLNQNANVKLAVENCFFKIKQQD